MSQDFYFGLTGGCIGTMLTIGLLLAIFGGENGRALDNCAKTHNVYQCEMVAVPKTGEK